MKFGELETVRLLGKGGMSEVWEAVNPRLGIHLAVKVYTYGQESAEVRSRFEQEGRLLARLNHPRIVGVRDIGRTDEDRPYFVMDLVQGPSGAPETLAQAFEKGVDEDMVARWYEDLREGLAYIHALGIVHRDLKLENVMVGPDGHVVLTDFGISRVSETKGGPTIADPVKTIVRIQNGEKPLMGSLGYMAPELEMGCAATKESDWYALGVIVYRLLTGTWCDARTDVVGTLDTFDPAWSKIVPKLLHANPAGRECLSFYETRRAQQEAAEAAAEARYLKEKSRGHVARHVARWMSGLAVLLAAALFWVGVDYRTEQKLWHQRLQQSGTHGAVPSFDELFAIPAAAKSDPMSDTDGNVTMPSRSDFSASRVDALVLTQPTLSALAEGRITPEKAVTDLEDMAEELEETSMRSPLDGLEFGGSPYVQVGDNESLRRLLLQAAKKIRERSEIE